MKKGKPISFNINDYLLYASGKVSSGVDYDYMGSKYRSYSAKSEGAIFKRAFKNIEKVLKKEDKKPGTYDISFELGDNWNLEGFYLMCLSNKFRRLASLFITSSDMIKNDYLVEVANYEVPHKDIEKYVYSSKPDKETMARRLDLNMSVVQHWEKNRKWRNHYEKIYNEKVAEVLEEHETAYQKSLEEKKNKSRTSANMHKEKNVEAVVEEINERTMGR